jgi:predicted DCC family thiol-disulfide oxidoreductase YuxK
MAASASNSSTAGDTGPKTTIYFDGSCPLCRREIGYYKESRGKDRLAFVDVAGQGDSKVAPDLERTAAMKRFHVRQANGRLLSGAGAFAEVWKQIPGWAWAGHIVAVPGIRHLADGVYFIYLRYRPGLQAWEKVLEKSDLERKRKRDLLALSLAGRDGGADAPKGPSAASIAAQIAADDQGRPGRQG